MSFIIIDMRSKRYRERKYTMRLVRRMCAGKVSESFLFQQAALTILNRALLAFRGHLHARRIYDAIKNLEQQQSKENVLLILSDVIANNEDQALLESMDSLKIN